MDRSPLTVSVVIPFFQRDAGLLTRALRSVDNQVMAPDDKISVVIVDDVSPISAVNEIAQLKFDMIAAPYIINSMTNVGPGGARNLGIEHAASGGADVIAFLDSDDEWLPQHLANALQLIRQGAEATFSDHARPGDYDSAFASHLVQFWQRRAVLDSRSKSEADSCTNFIVPAVEIYEGLAQEYLFQTSTVTYLLKPFENVRFETRLRTAGEDHLFWFDLAERAAAFGISMNSDVVCGRGVSIYYSALKWSDSGAANVFGFRFIMALTVLGRGKLNPEPQAALKRLARELRGKYIYISARNILRGHAINWRLSKEVLGSFFRKL